MGGGICKSNKTQSEYSWNHVDKYYVSEDPNENYYEIENHLERLVTIFEKVNIIAILATLCCY